MKIAIPVNEKNIETNVCASFGRSPYFLIYDIETQESNFIDNFAASDVGGAGIKAAQIIVDNEVEALLTPRCGEKAAEVLNSADIKIFKTVYPSAKENIQGFIDKKLNLLDEIHAGFHGHNEN
ncbi:MAG: dinitrogenase iron-molybdenum cofactor biosynthesis protein [Erysipelotrichaceae bacterium]|nr:dinitrogenase iron-molybdenum cofactor biosynthesis protein [Erysipelotrichaceae bacterium]